MTRVLLPVVAVSLVAATFTLPRHAGARIAVQPHIMTPASSLRTTSQALDDATIIAIFDAANTADMETSGLAAKKGYSKDVRALGHSFAAAHTAVRQRGRDLAKKLGITPTPPANDNSAQQLAKVMAELQSKSGPAFDLAYLQHEVAFHEAVIGAVTTTLLPAIQNQDLKKFVTTVAPAFQDHLAQAKKLLSERTAGN